MISSSVPLHPGVSSRGKKLGRPIGRTSSYQRNQAKQPEHYDYKRIKNNEAVRKSREKQKARLTYTLDLISKMEESNTKLEKDAELLRKELILLQVLYSRHVKTHGWTLPQGKMICIEDEKALAENHQKEQLNKIKVETSTKS
jgi:hypothetical protein